ncbi:MAG: hypothetical protein AAFQ45_14940 [Pseudomonadota bacterium]
MTAGRGVSSALLAAVAMFALAAPVTAGCELAKIETFLRDRAFALPADDKIRLYGQRVLRYYDKNELSKQQVLEAMRDWERRWPDRIYKYMRIEDFQETDARDACRVTFDYKFIAYDPGRDKTSAGIGRTSLVIAERGANGVLKIVGEWGTVRCRGVSKFVRGRC